MGYRSQVAIRCEEDAFYMFRDTYTEYHFDPDEVLLNAETNERLIKWNWIKWYEQYPEVAAIEDVMTELDMLYQNKDGYGYKFIRIGEDDEDVEDRSNNYDIELYILRDIDCPGNFK